MAKGGLVMKLQVTSSAITDNQPISAKFTADGPDVSPPLSWSNAPADTKSFVLLCDDPDAPGGSFVHWLLFDLPPDVTSLPEGFPRPGTDTGNIKEGMTDFGTCGYKGPAPPRGRPHHYHFKVFAIDMASIGLKRGARKPTVLNAVKGHVLAEGELVGTYCR
jgi:Raf kinase inhibitor-like YbhB/YbcL family protein